MPGPQTIRVKGALSGESTQEVGSDATNDAGASEMASASGQPPTRDPQDDALRTVMEDEGERRPWGSRRWLPGA